MKAMTRSTAGPRNRIAPWLAIGALILLVVAVPVVLSVMAGNPFGHWSLGAARRSLTSKQMFDSALVSHWLVRCAVALAWTAWTWMTICVALEVKGWLTGRSTKSLPASRTLQSVAACLVGTALAMSSVGRPVPGPLIAAIGHANQSVTETRSDITGHGLVGGVIPIIEDRFSPVETAHAPTSMDAIVLTTPGAGGAASPDRSGAVPIDSTEVATRTATPERYESPSTPSAASVEAAVHQVHQVRPRETLWSIASYRLGSAKRWREIAQLNYGAAQFDGRSLTDEHWILPGWTLALPTGSPSGRRGSASSNPAVSSPASSSPAGSLAGFRSSEASSGRAIDARSTRCAIDDVTVAQRNPWKHFPEDGRSLPHPGQPLPAVPLGGGIVGAGVVDLVDRLRRIQQRHREDGSFIKLPDRLRSQFERRLRAGEGASVPEAIDGALQLLASSWECGTWPAVRGARIHPDTVELVVDHPGGSVRIPPPFVDAGGFLRVDRGVLASRSRRFGRAQGRSPVPTLVTAGTAGGGVLLVDLESLGSLLVNGDEAGCENVIRALALELATSHWSGRFDVVLVGFGAEFERFERVTSVSDPQPLVLELCRRRLHGDALRNNAQVKSFAAARWFDDDACWAPLVVVCGPSVAAGSVQELLEVGSDPLGGTAVVAVGARRGGNGAAHSVRLTGGAPSAPLEQLAAVLTPQQVDADEFAEVAAILDVAEEKDSAPPSDDPYRDLQVPLPVAQPVAPAPGPPTPATARSVPFDRIRGGGSPTVHTRLDRPLVGDEEEDALDVIASITDAVGRETHQVGCEESEASSRRAPDTADPRPELREVEVLVLGPVEIRGASREFTRAWAKELVVYLAMHSRGASNEAWATALWPDRLMAPSSLHSTASVARRALGQSRGGADHLPRSHGRLALGPTVGTDWDRFVSLADSGQPAQWRSALELVRGRPFEGLRSSDWPILEGIGPAIESSVVDLSGRLAGSYLRVGDARGAEWSARKGLLVSPYDERLYRMLLRAADRAGNPAGVEAIMAELVRLVAEGVEPLESVHPSTLQLYRSLTRKKVVPRPGPGISGASTTGSARAGPALSGSALPRRSDVAPRDRPKEGAAS